MVKQERMKGIPTRFRRCAASGAQAAALPEQGAEEAAEQEKHRHPEAVDEVYDHLVGGVAGGGGVVDRPQVLGRGQHEEGPVQHHAQEHCHGPQGVQVVETLRPGVRTGNSVSTGHGAQPSLPAVFAAAGT